MIVGAGLGGLCCAVELARQGFEVCVLEQHTKPGGYAHGFKRRGWRFDASLHHLGGLDEGAMLRGLLTQLGVLDRLDLRRRDSLLRVELPGHHLNLPNDPAELVTLLGERFPAEWAGITAFFEELRSIKHDFTGPTTRPDFDRAPGDRLTTRHADLTLEDLVARHVQHPELAALLTSPWPYIGLPPSRVSAVFAACVLGSTWLEGAWRLGGGGEALSRTLVERLEELGGACVTRAEVDRILVEDGRVAGVATQGGVVVHAPVVISNANPFQTYRDLAPPDSLSPHFLARLERLEPSVSFYATYIGLDCPPSAIGIDQDEQYVLNGTDADEAWRRVVDGDLDHTDWSVASYERSDPDAAPKGAGVVTFMELTPSADWLDLEPETYSAHKAEARRRLVAKYAKRFPGLAEHARVVELATPRTMARYTRNHGGAVYGLAQTPNQAGRRRLSNRSPIHGLYLTGAWTWAGGGYEGALMSGLQTALAVLERHPAPAPQPRQNLTARLEDLPALPEPPEPPEDDREAYPQRLEVRVYQDAVEANGVAGPTAFLRFMDRGRVEACEATCSATEQASWLKLYLVNVYRIDASFLAPCPEGTRLEVRTGLRRVSSHRAVFDQQLADADTGLVVVNAAVEVTFLDPEQGLVPVPVGFDDRPSPRGTPGRGLAPIPFSDTEHYPHREPRRVYYEDTDAQGIAYHVTYLRWCEQALQELMRGTKDAAFQVERADVRYLEAARLGDRVEVRAGARPLEHGQVATDLRVIRLEDETVLADATLTLSFRSPGGEPVPVPEALRALMGEG